MISTSRSDSGCSKLSNGDDDELRGLEWREADDDVDHAAIDVGLGRGRGITFHQIGLRRCGSLKGALPVEAIHEGVDRSAKHRPQRLVVWFEHGPLYAGGDAQLHKDCQASYRNIQTIRAAGSAGGKRTRAPGNGTCVWKAAQAVDPQRVQRAAFRIIDIDGKT